MRNLGEKMRLIFAIVGMLAVLTMPAQALFDDFDELEGQTVIEAGDLKKLNCPIGGSYNCLRWPTSFYKLNAVCLEPVGGYVSGYSLRGLLTVDGNGRPSLFVISGLSSGDVKRHGVQLYDCPTEYY